MRTLSDNIHSAMLATAASLVFTINDGLMKYILAEFDLFVSLAIRGLFAVPMLVFFYLYEKICLFGYRVGIACFYAGVRPARWD